MCVVRLVKTAATERFDVESTLYEGGDWKCGSGKCRSSLAVDGQLNLECKERQR